MHQPKIDHQRIVTLALIQTEDNKSTEVPKKKAGIPIAAVHDLLLLAADSHKSFL
jgi:hypothetical protein